MLEALERLLVVHVSPMRVGNHPEDCCREARNWLVSEDRALSFRGETDSWSDPAWIRQRWTWGPVAWPLQWCGVAELGKLDSAALTSISTLLFKARQLPDAQTVQGVFRYPLDVANRWARLWREAGLSSEWIANEYVYHEITAVFTRGGIRLWDSTENRWLEAKHTRRSEYGALVALRLPAGLRPPLVPLTFEGITLLEEQWTVVGEGLYVDPRKGGLVEGLEAGAD